MTSYRMSSSMSRYSSCVKLKGFQRRAYGNPMEVKTKQPNKCKSSSRKGRDGTVYSTLQQEHYESDSHIDKKSTAKDFPKLVSFFRQASPYINQHWQKTFVIMIPGYIISDTLALDRILKDVALLHGLGVKIVIVAGASSLIDKTLDNSESSLKFSNGYRITDKSALEAAIAASGMIRIDVESRLSRWVQAGLVRRHGYQKESGRTPYLQVVSGNFITAKRRGIVNGIDFKHTGEVRAIWDSAIRQHLDQNHIVVLNNLGYNESGEVLNCSSFDVARKSCLALRADKLLVYHGKDISQLDLPAWLRLSDDYGDILDIKSSGWNAEDIIETLKLRSKMGMDTNTLAEISLAVQVCREGVPRTHLIDAYIDGSLFLELYTRDGVGTMVSRDIYEGMRVASRLDIAAIKQLLKPLEESGTLKRRSIEEIEMGIDNFIVVEREGRLIGSCSLTKLGEDVAELAAFVVHEQYRTEHRGDALLDFLEQQARAKNIKRLVLLTTRTSDWFRARGFEYKGTAYENEILPVNRRAAIDAKRNSVLFVKELDSGNPGPPGSRIGY